MNCKALLKYLAIGTAWFVFYAIPAGNGQSLHQAIANLTYRAAWWDAAATRLRALESIPTPAPDSDGKGIDRDEVIKALSDPFK